MPPIKLGKKNTDLNKLVPFKPLVRSKAKMKAKTLTVTTDTIVNKVVKPSALINSLSCVNAKI